MFQKGRNSLVEFRPCAMGASCQNAADHVLGLRDSDTTQMYLARQDRHLGYWVDERSFVVNSALGTKHYTEHFSFSRVVFSVGARGQG